MSEGLERKVGECIHPKCFKKNFSSQDKECLECYGFGAYKNENGFKICEEYHKWLKELKHED